MKKFMDYPNKTTASIAGLTFLALPLVTHADIVYRVISPIGNYDENGNPIDGITSFEGLLIELLNIFVIVAVPIIVLFIIYSGFLYVTAKGDVEQTKKATRSLTYAIIGGVLVIGAVAIAQVIGNTVTAFQAT